MTNGVRERDEARRGGGGVKPLGGEPQPCPPHAGGGGGPQVGGGGPCRRRRRTPRRRAPARRGRRRGRAGRLPPDGRSGRAPPGGWRRRHRLVASAPWRRLLVAHRSLHRARPSLRPSRRPRRYRLKRSRRSPVGDRWRRTMGATWSRMTSWSTPPRHRTRRRRSRSGRGETSRRWRWPGRPGAPAGRWRWRGGGSSSCAPCCPAGLTVGVGLLVSAVGDGRPLGTPLTVVGVAFALACLLSPIHTQLGAVLGDVTSGSLQAQLTRACSGPPGIQHLERPGLAAELVLARDFDQGITGPPLSVALGFISAGMVELLGGAAQAVVLGTVLWWAPFVVGGAWLATHLLLRQSSFWANRTDPDVMAQQQHADYAYRLAVDAAAGQGGAGLRARWLGRRPLRLDPPPAARPPVGGDAAAPAIAPHRACGARRRPCRWCSCRWSSAPPTATSRWRRWWWRPRP